MDGRSCVLTWMKGPPSTLALRGLVLLTKMLQQLANRQTITEDKGPELCQFNNLLVQSQEPLEAFSHRLVVSLPDCSYPPRVFSYLPQDALEVPLEVNDDLSSVHPVSACVLQEALEDIRSYIESAMPSVLKTLQDNENEELVDLLKEEYPNSDVLHVHLPEAETFSLSKVTRSVSQRNSGMVMRKPPKPALEEDDEQGSLELAEILVLKDLLKQENQRRNFIDQSLQNAQYVVFWFLFKLEDLTLHVTDAG